MSGLLDKFAEADWETSEARLGKGSGLSRLGPERGWGHDYILSLDFARQGLLKEYGHILMESYAASPQMIIILYPAMSSRGSFTEFVAQTSGFTSC